MLNIHFHKVVNLSKEKGKILVELKTTGATIEQVFVGGQAVVKRSLDNL